MYNKINFQRGIWLFFLICIFIMAGCSSLPATTNSTPKSTTPDSTPVIAHPVASKGCGQKSPVLPGQSWMQTIFADQLTRSYLLHIPIGYKDTIQQPLVLNFHGHGSNAQQQAVFSDFSVLADRQDFIVAYPQGVVGPDRNTGWSIGPARDPHVNDVLFVSDILNKLQSTLCINPARIYATGFSNGGGMTNMLACKMADRIAAFAPVSGSYPLVPGGCDPARAVPLLEFHGTGDNVVPYNGSIAKGYPPIVQWLKGWVARDGCAVTPKMTYHVPNMTEEQWTGCRDNVTLIHYQLAGWPHAWPHLVSASFVHPNPTHNTHGPSTSPTVVVSLDATPIIWMFFESHPLH